MKEIMDKISTYNFFNYLLPGIIFVTIANEFTKFKFPENNFIITIFAYYFIGLVISRVGSLVIEPFLIKAAFIEKVAYKSFISSSEQHEKIELLSEANNMYRTFISMLFLLLIIKCVEVVESKYPALILLNPYLLILSLLVIFLYSYRKQTQYISKRVRNK